MKLLTHLAVLSTFLLCPLLMDAQTAILMPIPVIQFSDVNGNPLAGGFVYTYEAGTSINQATYTDSTGATVNTDPVVLNAAGEPSSPLGPGFAGGIYLTAGANYRICVFSFTSVQQWCADNVQLDGGSAVGSSSNTQVLYNCAGNVCGSSGLTYNSGTQTLAVTALSVSSGGSLNGTFTGSPSIANLTVPGNGSFGNVTSDAAVNCSTAQAAATGFIRMCNTDQVNWRNSANTADEGLLAVSGGSNGDILRSIFPGGFDVHSTTPYLYFGGVTSAVPVIVGLGTGGVGVYLGNGGAPVTTLANITAAEAVLNGVTFPTTASPTAGQVLTVLSGGVTATWQTPALEAVLAQSTTTLASPVTVTGNTATTWISNTVTMPSSGCPCRVFASYSAYFSQGASGADVAWVYDGTNRFATAQTANTGSTSNYGINQSAFSTTTYANGAVVTFTGNFFTNSGSGNSVNVNTVTTGGSGAAQPSYLNLVIVPSS